MGMCEEPLSTIVGNGCLVILDVCNLRVADDPPSGHGKRY